MSHVVLRRRRRGGHRLLHAVAGGGALLVALALPATTAGAQGGGVRPGGAPVRPEGLSGPDAAALKLLERAATAYQSARTLRAEFTQRLSNPRTRTDLRSRGEFFQQGASRFAFRFSEPADDRIVADGDAIWLYSPSTARGQVFKMPRAAGMGIDLTASVLREPAQRYTIAALGDTTLDGRRVRAVRLVPKAAGGTFQRATLWLDLESALVRQAEFTEASGLLRTLTFTGIRIGGSLPRGVFTFTPPPGVRVIDQAAMLGGTGRP